MISSNMSLIIQELICFLISIVIIYFSFNSKQFQQLHLELIENLFTNWENKPIIDIIVSNGGLCPNEYEPILNEIWPGIIQGCACTPNILLKHICHENQKDECVNVKSFPAKNLYYWDGVKFCVKRSKKSYVELFGQKEILYDENLTYGNNSNNTFCTKLDNLENLFCSRNEEDNFINSFSFYNSRYQNLSYFNTTTSIKNFNLNNNKSLLVETINSNKSENSLLVDFVISEGNPCMDPIEKNTKFYPYRLLKNESNYFCTKQIEGSNLDSRYSLIEENLLLNYYDYNNMTSILENIPLFNFNPNNTEIGLYSRTYIGWNSACHKSQNLNPETFRLDFKNIYFIKSYQGFITLNSYIYTFLIVFSSIFKKFYPLLGLKRQENNYIPYVIDFINFIFSSLGLMITFYGLSYNSNLFELFSNIKKNNCGDHITNFVISQLADILELNITKNKILFWLFATVIVIMIACYIIYFLLVKVREKKNIKLIRKYSNINSMELEN